MTRRYPDQTGRFKEALGRFASGVTVVTVKDGDGVRGMTASSFISVSLSPPLILVSVDLKAHLQGALLAASDFGVSILARGQESLSRHFAGQGELKEVRFVYRRGVPLLEGSLTQLVCRRSDAYVAGDHRLFIGEVTELWTAPGSPLLYFQGQYGSLQVAPGGRDIPVVEGEAVDL